MDERIGIGPRGTWLLDLAKASAAVSNYCDHAEHNESVDLESITLTARTLRRIAVDIAADVHLDLFLGYATRLRQIERRNVLWHEGDIDGGRLVLNSSTWRGLQIAQLEHDRRYHPDVFGLSKINQLRHYAFHLAKLTGALAELLGDGHSDDFYVRRLPDLLLFSIKLSTVAGERLRDDPLPTLPVIERGCS